MANFPNWTFTVSSGVKASTAIRALITNYNLIESALRTAMRAAPSLEAYRSTLQLQNGNLSSGGISHHRLSSVTASQHHVKLHGTTHITATDPIPVVSAGGDGLMSCTLYTKVANQNTTGVRKPIAPGRYVGIYVASLPATFTNVINLGFQPSHIKIMNENVLPGKNGMWEVFEGYSNNWFHKVTVGTTPHEALVTNPITITSIGFSAGHPYFNRKDATYFFVALGE